MKNRLSVFRLKVPIEVEKVMLLKITFVENALLEFEDLLRAVQFRLKKVEGFNPFNSKGLIRLLRVIVCVFLLYLRNKINICETKQKYRQLDC